MSAVTNEQIIAYLDRLPADKLVLHGAQKEHKILKPAVPNQAHLIPEYNQRAVYGTLFTDIALVHAVIRSPKTEWGWKFDPEKKPHLFVQGPEFLSIGMGYIHILKRSDFTQTVEPGLVCLAFQEVVPVRVLRVHPNILEVLHKSKRLQFI